MHSPLFEASCMRIPVMANSDSEGSRTYVRVMADRCPGNAEESERSEATLFLKTSQIIFTKSI